MPDYGNIVYCTDFSEQADRAFEDARYMAGITGAKLFVLHVTPGSGGAGVTPKEQESSMESMRTHYASEGAEYVLRYGNEATEILQFADEQPKALIVLGARGVGALAGIFGGSIADKVTRHAKSPVLVVPNV
ncbi:MAG TPA: universal stress protein [Thermoleophilia bacterium]|nr:universal stress protein [Thermoleophilia bacterium]